MGEKTQHRSHRSNLADIEVICCVLCIEVYKGFAVASMLFTGSSMQLLVSMVKSCMCSDQCLSAMATPQFWTLPEVSRY